MKGSYITNYSLDLIEAVQPVKEKSFDIHDALQRSGTAAAMCTAELGKQHRGNAAREAHAWMVEHRLLLGLVQTNCDSRGAELLRTRLGHRRIKICGNLTRRNKDRNKGDHL